MDAHYRTIQDRRRALELYRQGLSTTIIGARMGISGEAVRDWMHAAGEIRSQVEGARIRRYHPATESGRARLDRLRAMVRMRVVDRMDCRAIAVAFGMSEGSAGYVRRLLKTPYARAVAAFVFGNATASRPQHARAMAGQGIALETICRTLGSDADRVRVWIETGKEL